ncbi:hypothetical protein DFQ28_005181 [Apophysomyces sp. BC1034]|nr:hypothetical protein DFQ30_006169 [Apophysomyces sp. BC1015]KAG0177661.1 hypothetical protein DFQ29_004557 [Apophysomyces sp. BC1021]KAG0188249.1 hypothetical protein DFQ28_005181 [Apophysomyces sp. BC1034]
MGVQHLWDVIGTSEKRFSLEEIANDRFHRKTNRGLRMAIDVAVWTFQVRSGQGGSHPDLRTMFYRCCRLYELGIRPVFVFDGPNRPEFKRDKIVQAGLVSQLQLELMAMFKHFNFGTWQAHGEAEAECAVLQRLDYVDIVLTADVDVFLFGAKRVIRQWPSHQNELLACYDHTWLTECTGLDRSDLIMMALLRGSDYNTRGVRGIGITLAEGLVRTKYHTELMDRLQTTEGSVDEAQLQDLYDAFMYEINTGRSGYLKRRYGSIELHATSHDVTILKDWVHPVTNIAKPSCKGLARELLELLNRDHTPDLSSLAAFSQRYFEWPKAIVLAKFANLIYPGYMSQKLRTQVLLVNDYHSNRNHLQNTTSKPFSSHKQRYMNDYFQTRKPSHIEKRRSNPEPDDQAKVDMIRITQEKVVRGTKLYRVEWTTGSLQEFLDKVSAKLHNTQSTVDFSEDEEQEWHSSQHTEQGNIYNPSNKIYRQWVDAQQVNATYPPIVRAYECKKPQKPRSNTDSPQGQACITDFLILPPRRQSNRILRSDILEDPFN